MHLGPFDAGWAGPRVLVCEHSALQGHSGALATRLAPAARCKDTASNMMDTPIAARHGLARGRPFCCCAGEVGPCPCGNRHRLPESIASWFMASTCSFAALGARRAPLLALRSQCTGVHGCQQEVIVKSYSRSFQTAAWRLRSGANTHITPDRGLINGTQRQSVAFAYIPTARTLYMRSYGALRLLMAMCATTARHLGCPGTQLPSGHRRETY